MTLRPSAPWWSERSHRTRHRLTLSGNRPTDRVAGSLRTARSRDPPLPPNLIRAGQRPGAGPTPLARDTVFTISADPAFGVLVSFGIGGVATELFDDRVYRAVPLTDIDAWELISAPRAALLLDGHWGARVVAREPLVDLALRLSQLADDLPEVSDLKLRPVLAGPAGVAVTSGTARIGPALAQPHVKRRLH